jgi:hypothetical protein
MDLVRAITRASYEIEVTTPRTYLESARLMRVGRSEIGKHRDGISIASPFVAAMSTVGLFDRFEGPVKGNTNHARIMERWLPFETGSGYLWIGSPAGSRAAQITSGRAYVRSHLAATAQGIDMHPLSQALQEFPEVRPQLATLHELLAVNAQTTTIQMLVRVGFGVAPGTPSPRRRLTSFIRT